MILNEMTDIEIIECYSQCIKELKARDIIRTKNVLGELGEYLSVRYYNSTPGLPNLQPAPVGTQNIDAISRNGDRYSIKATSTNTTGVFYGLPDPDSKTEGKQSFEFVIICRFDDDYQLNSIFELPWDKFIANKHWHSRMRAWNLCLTRKLISDCKIIY